MSPSVQVEKGKNGFTLLSVAENGDVDEMLAVVEGTNPRTVAAKLGRAVIKALTVVEKEDHISE